MARVPRGRGGRASGRGRGRGRGVVPASSSSEATSQTHPVETASEASAGVSVTVGAGRGAGFGAGIGVGPGGGAAPAQGRDEVIVGLLTQLLERFPAVVPVPAPVVPPVVEVQQVAAGVEQPRAVAAENPPYLVMMGQMQKIGTPFFTGRVGPEAAEEWRLRVERNFRSIRCPAEYCVELAVHYLSEDAHSWWRSIEARRVEWTWKEFVGDFNAKFFPREALDRLQMRFMELTQGASSVREYDAEFSRLQVYASYGVAEERALMQRFLQGLRLGIRTLCRGAVYATRAELVELAASIEEDQRVQAGSDVVPSGVVPSVVAPTVQPRRQQQQQFSRGSGLGKGGKPTQGQKRRFDEVSGGGQGSRGCFGCGSLEHRVANCPKYSGEAKVCFHCREPGHIRPMCPKLQPLALAVVQPIAAQPITQIAPDQPLDQFGRVQRGQE